jgi:hypothetical protein
MVFSFEKGLEPTVSRVVTNALTPRRWKARPLRAA